MYLQDVVISHQLPNASLQPKLLNNFLNGLSASPIHLPVFKADQVCLHFKM